MKFWVLFRAPWTGGRWVPWAKPFATVGEARQAIAARRAESPCSETERMVATLTRGVYWEVE